MIQVLCKLQVAHPARGKFHASDSKKASEGAPDIDRAAAAGAVPEARIRGAFRYITLHIDEYALTAFQRLL